MASFADKYGGYCTCTRDKCTDDCATYRRFKPKPITNYDRIISMKPEELAEWIYSVQDEDALRKGNFLPPLSKSWWLDWLKQEATK